MPSSEGAGVAAASGDVVASNGAGGIDSRRKRRMARKAEKQLNRNNSSKRHSINLWLLIVPFLILSLLFSYLPLFGWVYAFYDYKPPIPLSESEFVGLQ